MNLAKNWNFGLHKIRFPEENYFVQLCPLFYRKNSMQTRKLVVAHFVCIQQLNINSSSFQIFITLQKKNKAGSLALFQGKRCLEILGKKERKTVRTYKIWASKRHLWRPIHKWIFRWKFLDFFVKCFGFPRGKQWELTKYGRRGVTCDDPFIIERDRVRHTSPYFPLFTTFTFLRFSLQDFLFNVVFALNIQSEPLLFM